MMMGGRWLQLFSASLCFLSVARLCAGEPSPVWPVPSAWSKAGDESSVLDPSSFTMRYSGAGAMPKALAMAFARYQTLFFPHKTSSSSSSSSRSGGSVTVSILSPDEALTFGTNESYALTSGVSSTIVAATTWGALRGLETLSQLISFDFGTELYSVAGYSITDAPRFSHRGLLVDSGRHFEPIPALMRLVESMSYAKLNVLHWHLTEDQSFPMPSTAYPELPAKGAYGPTERYSRGDVQELVAFASALGVRVIPEFDMPGHTSSWSLSHPEIFAAGCSLDERGALDPAKDETWELLEAQLHEWATLFPDAFVHLGSDEVPSTCWNNTADLEWMKMMNFSDFNQVYNYFVNRASQLVVAPEEKNNNKTVLLWDEAFSSAVPDTDTTVIQNWHSDALLADIVDAGYRGLASSEGYWYLDHLDVSWDDMYTFDPHQGIPEENQPLVIGGEGCMWGETVDPSDIEATIWPRLAAIAERLWSPQDTLLDDDTLDRLTAFRCLLLSRGVKAGLVNGTARAPPPGPGACSQLGTA